MKAVKILTMRTENNNFLCAHKGMFFYIGEDRKTFLRWSDEGEWEYAENLWGVLPQMRYIFYLPQEVVLSAICGLKISLIQDFDDEIMKNWYIEPEKSIEYHTSKAPKRTLHEHLQYLIKKAERS